MKDRFVAKLNEVVVISETFECPACGTEVGIAD